MSNFADYLKAKCKMIHFFGLGFIQIKVSNSQRYHFYSSELPGFVDQESVHNHRYDFTSTILGGKLKQEIFSVVPGDVCAEFLMKEESCRSDVKAPDTEVPCSLSKLFEDTHVKGSTYTIDKDTFHKVTPITDSAVTFLTRGPVKKEFATVVSPKGAKFVCPFSMNIPEDDLWRLVSDIAIQLQL